MSQFAFAKNGNGSNGNIDRDQQSKDINIANNPRKRRRSSDLLPTRPSQSVDYRNDDTEDNDKYESRPHQFRPPRRITQFNNDRSKKRRLNGNGPIIRRNVESPFIPKQSGSFALPTNTKLIPNLSSYAFNRNSNSNHNRKRKQPLRKVDTLASMESFCSDVSPENRKYMNHERVTQVNARKMNEKTVNDPLSQFSITEYRPNSTQSRLESSLLVDTQNDGYYDEDDDDVLDDEFLRQYPLPNTNDNNLDTLSYDDILDGTGTTVNLSENDYIPETPEPPEAGDITSDVSMGHDDGIGNKKYIPSSLEMGALNNDNNDFDLDDDETQIEDEVEQYAIDDGLDVNDNFNDFSVPLDNDPIDVNINGNLNGNHKRFEPRDDNTINLLEDTQLEDDILEDDILSQDNDLDINLNGYQHQDQHMNIRNNRNTNHNHQPQRNKHGLARRKSPRLITSSPTSPLENVNMNGCIDLTVDDPTDNLQRNRSIMNQSRREQNQPQQNIISLEDDEIGNEIDEIDGIDGLDDNLLLNDDLDDNLDMNMDQYPDLYANRNRNSIGSNNSDPIVLSDDDKENNLPLDNLDNHRSIAWKKKKRSLSGNLDENILSQDNVLMNQEMIPDTFDMNDFGDDTLEDDLQSVDILRDEDAALNTDDDVGIDNHPDAILITDTQNEDDLEQIPELPESGDIDNDDMFINTMPLDRVVLNPVRSRSNLLSSSPRKRSTSPPKSRRGGRKRHRDRLPLRTKQIDDIGLGELDYFL